MLRCNESRTFGLKNSCSDISAFLGSPNIFFDFGAGEPKPREINPERLAKSIGDFAPVIEQIQVPTLVRTRDIVHRLDQPLGRVEMPGPLLDQPDNHQRDKANQEVGFDSIFVGKIDWARLKLFLAHPK